MSLEVGIGRDVFPELFPVFQRACRRALGDGMSNRQPKEHYDYAERVRDRLPRRLQEARERSGLSRYALGKRSGISREMINRIERGTSHPSVCVVAQLAHALGLKLHQLLTDLGDEPE